MDTQGLPLTSKMYISAALLDSCVYCRQRICVVLYGYGEIGVMRHKLRSHLRFGAK